jgi:hypothetical protein
VRGGKSKTDACIREGTLKMEMAIFSVNSHLASFYPRGSQSLP